MKVSIKVESINKAKLFIDDKEIERVTKINFNTAVDEVPTVTLELMLSEVDIQADDVLVLEERSLDNYSAEELIELIAKKCINKAFENNR